MATKKLPFIKFERANKIRFLDEDKIALLGKYLTIAGYPSGVEFYKFECKKDLKLPYANEFDFSEDQSRLVLKSTQGKVKTYLFPSAQPVAETRSSESSVFLSAKGDVVLDLKFEIRERSILYQRDFHTLEGTVHVFDNQSATHMCADKNKSIYALKRVFLAPDDTSPLGDCFFDIYEVPEIEIPVKSILAPSGNCRKIWISPDATCIAYSYMDDNREDWLDIMLLEKEEVLLHLGPVKVGGYYDVAWSEDEQMMAIAKGDAWEIWDFAKKAVLKRIDEPGCYNIAFSPCSQYLALAFYSKATKLYEIKDILENS